MTGFERRGCRCELGAIEVHHPKCRRQNIRFCHRSSKGRVAVNRQQATNDSCPGLVAVSTLWILSMRSCGETYRKEIMYKIQTLKSDGCPQYAHYLKISTVSASAMRNPNFRRLWPGARSVCAISKMSNRRWVRLRPRRSGAATGDPRIQPTTRRSSTGGALCNRTGVRCAVSRRVLLVG